MVWIIKQTNAPAFACQRLAGCNIVEAHGNEMWISLCPLKNTCIPFPLFLLIPISGFPLGKPKLEMQGENWLVSWVKAPFIIGRIKNESISNLYHKIFLYDRHLFRSLKYCVHYYFIFLVLHY